jgi:hypothetical protein
MLGEAPRPPTSAKSANAALRRKVLASLSLDPARADIGIQYSFCNAHVKCDAAASAR